MDWARHAQRVVPGIPRAPQRLQSREGSKIGSAERRPRVALPIDASAQEAIFSFHAASDAVRSDPDTSKWSAATLLSAFAAPSQVRRPSRVRDGRLVLGSNIRLTGTALAIAEIRYLCGGITATDCAELCQEASHGPSRAHLRISRRFSRFGESAGRQHRLGNSGAGIPSWRCCKPRLYASVNAGRESGVATKSSDALGRKLQSARNLHPPGAAIGRLFRPRTRPIT